MIRAWAFTCFAGIVWGNAQGVLEWIILIAAAITALGVMHVKVVAPLLRFSRRAAQGVDILLDLPERHGALELRLSRVETQLNERTLVVARPGGRREYDPPNGH